jgi:hypothetical protein
MRQRRSWRMPYASSAGGYSPPCTEQLGPFEIVAFDDNGSVLARISHDGQPPAWPKPAHRLK